MRSPSRHRPLQLEELETRLVLTTPTGPGLFSEPQAIVRTQEDPSTLPTDVELVVGLEEIAVVSTTEIDQEFFNDPNLNRVLDALGTDNTTFAVVPNLPDGEEFIDEVPTALGSNLILAESDLANPVLRSVVQNLAGGEANLNRLLSLGEGLQLHIVDNSVLQDPFLFDLVTRVARDDANLEDFLGAGEGLSLLNFEAQFADVSTLRGTLLIQLQQRAVNNLENVLRQEADKHNDALRLALPLKEQINEQLTDLHGERLTLLQVNPERASFHFQAFRSGTDFEGNRINPGFVRVPDEIVQSLTDAGKDPQSLYRLVVNLTSQATEENPDDPVFEFLRSELKKFETREEILLEALENLPEAGNSTIFQLRFDLNFGSDNTKDVETDENGFLFIVDLTRDIESQKVLPDDPTLQARIQARLTEINDQISTAEFEQFLEDITLTPIEEAFLIEEELRSLIAEGSVIGFTEEAEERIAELEDRLVELNPELPAPNEEFVSSKVNQETVLKKLLEEGRLNPSVLDQPQEDIGFKALRTFVTGVVEGLTFPVTLARDLDNLVQARFGFPVGAAKFFDVVIDAGNATSQFVGDSDGGAALARFRNEGGIIQAITEKVKQGNSQNQQSPQEGQVDTDVQEREDLGTKVLRNAVNGLIDGLPIPTDLITDVVDVGIAPRLDLEEVGDGFLGEVIETGKEVVDFLREDNGTANQGQTVPRAALEVAVELGEGLGKLTEQSLDQITLQALDKVFEGDLEGVGRFVGEELITGGIPTVKAADTAVDLAFAARSASNVAETADIVADGARKLDGPNSNGQRQLFGSQRNPSGNPGGQETGLGDNAPTTGEATGGLAAGESLNSPGNPTGVTPPGDLPNIPTGSSDPTDISDLFDDVLRELGEEPGVVSGNPIAQSPGPVQGANVFPDDPFEPGLFANQPGFNASSPEFGPTNSQATSTFALDTNLAEPEERAKVLQRLVDLRKQNYVLTPGDEFLLRKATVLSIEDVIRKNQADLQKARNGSLLKRIFTEKFDSTHSDILEDILESENLIQEARIILKLGSINDVGIGGATPFRFSELGKTGDFFRQYDSIVHNFAVPNTVAYAETYFHELVHHFITRYLAPIQRYADVPVVDGSISQKELLKFAKVRFGEETVAYQLGRMGTGVRAFNIFGPADEAVRSMQSILRDMTPQTRLAFDQFTRKATPYVYLTRVGLLAGAGAGIYGVGSALFGGE